MVEIKASAYKYLDELNRLFLEAFELKFGKIFNTKDKIASFINEYNLAKSATGSHNFIALENERVLGYLEVKFEGVHHEEENVSLKNFFRDHNFKQLYQLFTLAIIADYKPKPNELYVATVAVLSTARGKGVGTKLLQRAIELAKEKDYERITLHVMIENEGAKKLYEKMGFKVIHTKASRLMENVTPYTGTHLMEIRFK